MLARGGTRAGRPTTPLPPPIHVPDVRELDCDFCGGTAAGAYQVLPDELETGGDEQARVVLCAGCRETLDGVLAPLLDRLGVRDEGGVDPSVAGDAAGQATAAAKPTDDGVAEGGDDPALAADAAGHAPPPTEASTADSGGDGDAEPDAGSTTADDAAETATDPSESAESTAPAGAEPPNFRKVMRFCNNREFPVDRAEVSEFAAGAYDLEDHEVAEIFDYAIERGILAEENGQLVKG